MVHFLWLCVGDSNGTWSYRPILYSCTHAHAHRKYITAASIPSHSTCCHSSWWHKSLWQYSKSKLHTNNINKFNGSKIRAIKWLVRNGCGRDCGWLAGWFVNIFDSYATALWLFILILLEHKKRKFETMLLVAYTHKHTHNLSTWALSKRLLLW